MLETYRRVLVVPGAAAFSATGLVARLPISMVSLGLVLLVSARTGSYGSAGSVAAAYVLAQAVATIVHGRLSDTYGQARALPPAILLFGVGLTATAWSVEAGLPLWATHVLAVVAGCGLPQVGACVRARWSHVLQDSEKVQTAFALEAVADEVVFILGPVVVTLLATTVDPVAGLAVAVVSGVAGTLALAAQRGTQPPPTPRGRRAPEDTVAAPMPWDAVVPLTVVCLSLGGLFGSVEVITVAYAEEAGVPAAAGPLLAAFAAGSLLAGVVVGAVTWRRGPEHRLRWGMGVLTAAMLPLTVVGPVWLMAVVLLLGGFAISPTLISAMSLAEAVVPSSRLTEGIAILSTGISAGLAPGAALGGLAVDAYGASLAFGVCAASGVVGIVGTALVRAPAKASTVTA
ncbi:MFS transporter [Nocardioides sp. CFH 31398]|uniref:MFS transporter n=1 Tax=Nocardioides sp. CFH 31398 TaxID=2919579 RepID=UPI001F05273C|nr:MFS transporter [Nocardioides sp. CFH 31398]MCH1866637.1 MFS transporter [Nocardioides sp. CFH 31398]